MGGGGLIASPHSLKNLLGQGIGINGFSQQITAKIVIRIVSFGGFTR